MYGCTHQPSHHHQLILITTTNRGCPLLSLLPSLLLFQNPNSNFFIFDYFAILLDENSSFYFVSLKDKYRKLFTNFLRCRRTNLCVLEVRRLHSSQSVSCGFASAQSIQESGYSKQINAENYPTNFEQVVYSEHPHRM